jgi:hypothetical protein
LGINVNSAKYKVSISIAVATIRWSFILQKPVFAADIYELGAFNNFYTNTAGPVGVRRGSTFKIGSGYQATYSK